MTLKSKIIILLSVYALGYSTALKLRPAPLELTQSNTQEVRAKKAVRKKTYAPTGKLVSEEESIEDLDIFVGEKLKAIAPPQAIYKRDAVIIDLDSTLRAGILIKPYAILPLPMIPKDLYLGYVKDMRTGEDIYRAAYTVFTKE